jgi:hypothetical protein
MTSPTDKTENRRLSKKFAMGRSRKNKLRKIGTTPVLFVSAPTSTDNKK